MPSVGLIQLYTNIYGSISSVADKLSNGINTSLILYFICDIFCVLRERYVKSKMAEMPARIGEYRMEKIAQKEAMVQRKLEREQKLLEFMELEKKAILSRRR